MSYRPVLSIVSCGMCFVVLGCGTPQSGPSPAQQAMQSILAEDEQLGEIRNHASESASLADAVREYVAALDALDFSGCPSEFVEAFRSHRDVWNESLPFFEQFPELRGEMHDLFERLQAVPDTKEQIEAIDKRVWDTWADVENCVKE